VRPGSAPPAFSGGRASAERAVVRSASDAMSRRQRGSELEPLRRQLRSQVGTSWPPTLLRALQSRPTVDIDLLQAAFRSLGIVGATTSQLRCLLRDAAPDGGKPSAESIIGVLHGPLARQRALSVRVIFAALDVNGAGYLSLNMLKRRCVAVELPAVRNSRVSAAEALQGFLRPWRNVAQISVDDFAAGHGSLSCLWTGTDESFARLLCRLWRIPLDSGTALQAGVEQQAKANKALTSASDVAFAPAPQQIKPPPVGKENVRNDLVISTSGQGNFERDIAPSSKLPREAKRRSDVQRSLHMAPRSMATIERLRAALKRCGPSAASSLFRRLRLVGGRRGGVVDAADLRAALRHIGVGISDADVEDLACLGDLDGSGFVDVELIIESVSVPLSPQRAALVRQVFRLLDQDGDGLLSVEELQERFVPGRHPDVERGRKNGREVLLELRGALDEMGSGGRLSAPDFLRFYENISAGIDNDRDFAYVLRSTWGLDSGPDTLCARNIRRAREGTIQMFEGGLG